MRKTKGKHFSKPQRLRFQAEHAARATGKSEAEIKMAGDAAFASFDKTAWEAEKRRRWPSNYA
jgi:hypothetical protein